MNLSVDIIVRLIGQDAPPVECAETIMRMMPSRKLPRLPHGPNGFKSFDVASHQRVRLYCALGRLLRKHNGDLRAFTVGDILDEAGVSRRAFYENFKTKDHFFRKALLLAERMAIKGMPEHRRTVEVAKATDVELESAVK